MNSISDTAKKNYNKWLSYNELDEKLKYELKHLKQSQIEELFCKYLQFGTGGLRGVMGVGTNRINIYTIRKITEGYARWIDNQKSDAKRKGIVISYDNRHYSKIFAIESAKVLARHNIKTFIFSDLRPTPELSFAIREYCAFGGIAITASHNSAEYNGYKIYDNTGCQCVLKYTDEIIKYIDTVEDELTIEVGNKEQCGNYISIVDCLIDELYYKRVLDIQLHPELDKSNLKIVFTPQHGTTGIPVQTVLNMAGYTVLPVNNQMNPDPDFTNTKDPNPENPLAFEEAMKIAKKNDADCILSTDPDGDRVAVVVKHRESFIYLTGNQLGAILLNYIIEERYSLKTMPKNPIVYNTIVTSGLGDFICQKYGIPVQKTLTGFKFIGEKIKNIEGSDINFLFAYEESCGYLISDMVRDKDGIQASLFICEVVNFYKKKNKSLIDVLNELYSEFGNYLDIQKSMKIDSSNASKKINDLISKIRCNSNVVIDGQRVIKIEDFENGICIENNKISKLNYPKSKVVKLYLEDKSWVAVRPSGTEPKIKFYFFDKGHNLLRVMEDFLNG